MKNEFRLATNDDADNLLNLTLQAYKPIQEIGIPFLAATADLALVKKNISQNLCYAMYMKKRKESLQLCLYECLGENIQVRLLFRIFGGLQ